MYGYARRQADVWRFAADKLEAGTGVTLLYVLESRGSSPGRQGFFMMVAQDRTFCGSIGGGIMEHKFVEMALSAPVANDNGNVYLQIHDKSSARNQSGMICSGEQTVLLLGLRDSDVPTLRAIAACWLQEGQGTLTLSPNTISYNTSIPKQEFYLEKRQESDFLFQARIGLWRQLHIIGGGHCSLALSRLMADMDFHISVWDDRPGLSTMAANAFAHQSHTVQDYSELAGLIPTGAHVFVVIMTFGYRTDDLAFRALHKGDYQFLGMLGSGRKIQKMLDTYRSEGFPEADLKKLTAPVGLFIKSETPEEIAVSIAAQLIAVRRQG